MQNLKKKIRGSLVALFLFSTVTMSFQNCSSGFAPLTPTSETGITSNSSLDTSGVSQILTYPDSGVPVTLVPGQNITLKMTKPSYMVNASDYLWIIPSDDYSLASYYGLITEANGSIYVSLSVRSAYAHTKKMRIYFLKLADYSYADTTGLGILIDPAATGQQYAVDSISEVCAVRSDYVPTFLFDTSKSAADALTVFDNGAGIGSLECLFGETSVDCLTPAAWPSDWSSRNLSINAYNRCGTPTTRTF